MKECSRLIGPCDQIILSHHRHLPSCWFSSKPRFREISIGLIGEDVGCLQGRMLCLVSEGNATQPIAIGQTLVVADDGKDLACSALILLIAIKHETDLLVPRVF